MSMHTHTRTRTQKEMVSLNTLGTSRCAAELGRLIGKWTEGSAGDRDLVTGRGATVYRWRSSRHTWSHTQTHTHGHTHTHRREEMSIAAVAGHFRVEQADRRRGLRRHKCGKDGNCCINMLISLYRRQRPAVCLSVNNLRTNQRLLPPLA